ncbi:Ycf66 family protein [Nodularia harveyana UHCC-0300]|uniref:Ycf66 family protein n=1 Tax=Nodularia harveyana UHCC-0300 TaxID=2974287 RepID=A0ABU5UBL2_9CYAN|nr:Ycf66 family protein [Nodularia harveyana]MEA5579841.1 Ycf66 family protein [Nodularia harveyana UHCC-0300]
MLAYILALVVGLGSLAIYIAAFFFPEIHRKNDFIWSGVGLFYALVLWVFAPRISGGLLLGHVASVALLVWFGWETLSLRRQLTPQMEQTPVPSPETIKTGIQEKIGKLSFTDKLAQVQGTLGNILSGGKNKVQQAIAKKTPETPKTETKTSATPQKPDAEMIDQTSATVEAPAEEKVATEDVAEVTPSSPPAEAVGSDETKSATEDVAEVVAAVPSETEEKAPIPTEEIPPDTTPAPPAAAPPENIPPNNQAD